MVFLVFLLGGDFRTFSPFLCTHKLDMLMMALMFVAVVNMVLMMALLSCKKAPFLLPYKMSPSPKQWPQVGSFPLHHIYPSILGTNIDSSVEELHLQKVNCPCFKLNQDSKLISLTTMWFDILEVPGPNSMFSCLSITSPSKTLQLLMLSYHRSGMHVE